MEVFVDSRFMLREGRLNNFKCLKLGQRLELHAVQISFLSHDLQIQLSHPG
jgi:hypothetical protein